MREFAKLMFSFGLFAAIGACPLTISFLTYSDYVGTQAQKSFEGGPALVERYLQSRREHLMIAASISIAGSVWAVGGLILIALDSIRTAIERGPKPRTNSDSSSAKELVRMAQAMNHARMEPRQTSPLSKTVITCPNCQQPINAESVTCPVCGWKI